MSIHFNADEVLEVAVRIEENGAKFYRKAADIQSEAENRAFLEKLASMEDEHGLTFIEMRQQLTEEEREGQVFDPNGEISLYLNALADTHGGEGTPSVADSLTGQETFQEILKIAIDLEKNSILHYLGLRDMVPPRLGKDKVDAIISEERKHIAQLATALAKVRQG
jgi:rubrerythrin